MEDSILKVNAFESQQVEKAVNFTAQNRPRYVPPTGRIHDDWLGCKLENYKPTSRQMSVISAVDSALTADLFTTSDVLKYCIDYLSVTPEQSKVGASRVEGGDVGLDCYHARDYLRHVKEHASHRKALSMLKPFVGQELGTLLFKDFKRNTGAIVKAVNGDTNEITLHCKRGRYVIELICSASQIEYAMNRAFECKLRKDKFGDVFKHNQTETPATASH